MYLLKLIKFFIILTQTFLLIYPEFWIAAGFVGPSFKMRAPARPILSETIFVVSKENYMELQDFNLNYFSSVKFEVILTDYCEALMAPLNTLQNSVLEILT